MGLYPKHRDLTKPPTEVELSVDCSGLRMRADDVNIRLDAFLVHYLTWRSRSSIQALIHDGFVLVGTSRVAHADVMGQFERREIDKEYLAIVRGSPESDGGTIDYPIGSCRVSDIELKMGVQADGLPSRTDWRIVSRARTCTL